MEKGTSRKSFFDDEEDPICTKIYYASRTHSQLAQILPELRRLKLSPLVTTPTHCGSSVDIPQKRAAPDDLLDEDEMPVVFSRTVSLGSRKQLCINDNVRSKSKDLDEGCRELLEGEFKSHCMLATNLLSASEKGDKRCPYLPPLGEESQMVDFRDQILVRH